MSQYELCRWELLPSNSPWPFNSSTPKRRRRLTWTEVKSPRTSPRSFTKECPSCHKQMLLHSLQYHQPRRAPGTQVEKNALEKKVMQLCFLFENQLRKTLEPQTGASQNRCYWYLFIMYVCVNISVHLAINWFTYFYFVSSFRSHESLHFGCNLVFHFQNS